jgi:hypothetical protein
MAAQYSPGGHIPVVYVALLPLPPLSLGSCVENDRGNPRVEKGLPLPLPPQNPYPRQG